MTQNAKPLNAEEIDEAQLHHDRFCNVCKPESRICAAARLLATIDQQAKQLECGECGNPKGFAILCADCWSHYYQSVADVTIATPSDKTPAAAFGSAALRHILTDTSFFESEESEQWCELLQRHGYVERGIWDSAKHGESNVLGDGDEAWIFTEKMRRDAARPGAAPGDETPTIAYWRRNAHEALDRMIEAQVTARLGNRNEEAAYLKAQNETVFLVREVVNHVTNARLAAARSEKDGGAC